MYGKYFFKMITPEVRKQEDQLSHRWIISILHMWLIQQSPGSPVMWLRDAFRTGKKSLNNCSGAISARTWIAFQAWCEYCLSHRMGAVFDSLSPLECGCFTFSKNITLDPFFSSLQKLHVGYLWAELFHTFWSVIRKTCNPPDSCNLRSYTGSTPLKHVDQNYFYRRFLKSVMMCVSYTGTSLPQTQQYQVVNSCCQDWLANWLTDWTCVIH